MAITRILTANKTCHSLVSCLLLLFLAYGRPLLSQGLTPFLDQPLQEPIILPDWFKLSFLDLNDDVDEAIAAGKKGIIVYFGREDCPYCKAHLENNWHNPEIVKYTRKYFDVIAIDVKGDRNVTAIDGTVYDEKQFAALHRTNFTPSFLFYDANKNIVLKLQGYHPPYEFRAALEYVAGGHYQRESFREYLSRAELAESYGENSLNSHPSFMKPPYLLDRSHIPAKTPLAVFFEEKHCHACDILHAGPLANEAISGKLKSMDVVQLDMGSDTKLITPGGEHVTARQWAEKLGLYYSPTIIFFDQHGEEIIRIDSVVWVYRLNHVLDYVLSGDYRKYKTYQLWRTAMNRKKQAAE